MNGLHASFFEDLRLDEKVAQVIIRGIRRSCSPSRNDSGSCPWKRWLYRQQHPKLLKKSNYVSSLGETVHHLVR